MQGYTMMLSEIATALSEQPTHVFLQGGVGGLAASASAFLAMRYGEKRPTAVVVEPDVADCLFQSAAALGPRRASGNLDTFMLGMACGEVSTIAWNILAEAADAFMTITDDEALAAMRCLNRTASDGSTIVAGECAGAGLAGLQRAIAQPELKDALGLDEASRVLLIGTEGATDRATWTRLAGNAGP
jgi:diaminopropionate ammonia-lyase